jgi:hypothetical protein
VAISGQFFMAANREVPGEWFAFVGDDGAPVFGVLDLGAKERDYQASGLFPGGGHDLLSKRGENGVDECCPVVVAGTAQHVRPPRGEVYGRTCIFDQHVQGDRTGETSSTTPVSRGRRFFMIYGSNVDPVSRGTSILSGPISVSTVLVPLRGFRFPSRPRRIFRT